jgi:hypothetical protein
MMATLLEPQAAQTKRCDLAMFGNGDSGATPIASKLTAVDRGQIGLQHVARAPAAPRNCGSAIAGGAADNEMSRMLSETLSGRSRLLLWP